MSIKNSSLDDLDLTVLSATKHYEGLVTVLKFDRGNYIDLTFSQFC